jgi:subtilisin family serine protease
VTTGAVASDEARYAWAAAGVDRLMSIAVGRAEIGVALLDGPVALSHPDLADARIRIIGPATAASCRADGSPACRHGTSVAGILSARRSSAAPGICPGCTLVVRPIFENRVDSTAPRATAAELAGAIVESVEAGARIINVSSALSPTVGREPGLESALDMAARHGALVIVAAGNDGAVGSSSLTRHTSAIPVTACDAAGRPLRAANLSRSFGTRGIAAPGVVTAIASAGPPVTLRGTSFAAAVVSGVCGLLWSLFPDAAGQEITWALAGLARRTSVAPPPLAGWQAYERLAGLRGVAA